MTKTLVLLFHPDLSRSKSNAALAGRAGALPNVEVIDMQGTYPGGMDMYRDGEREAARLLEAARIVLQFPVQWYSTPPLLKAWQDAVLTRMFYIAYEAEGRHLEGRPLMIAATAGNTAEAYRPGGANMFAIADIFTPLRATANRCGLIWTTPFVLYSADKLSAGEIETAGENYAAALTNWIANSGSKKRISDDKGA
ncbi:NADPH-dependent FMN reductase family protein (plasmid) [Ochrobactrum quorumnocens]|uniref:NADPH-dependent FMN reductase family protein n=1 Tax=Ochrobactrum quorumnocens TaxID=271865 RepID=A0A248UPF0_9HYPH|nr:NAD(P)H-dependent oxidoreductase [[Ochrobactrum] quorumnocens]ASV88261.1 NADPH-dependent FMN reductase family protein [[Ochrobactrum] quorumnocens]